MMSYFDQVFALDGEVALVTGGSSGLGYAIAEAFLRSGVDVAICGNNPDKAAALQEVAQECGKRYLAVRCDVTNANQIDKMLDEIEQKLGPVQLLVNSAGINIRKPAEDYDEDSFDQVMDLNVKGTHLVCKAVAKRWMIPAGKGSIVNLSSVKGFIGAKRDYAGYCASKGAVNMYTKQLACEWAQFGIRSNVIAPTFVLTNISQKQLSDKEFYETLVNRIPLGRIGELKDVAAAAIYLCSKGASFVNGQLLCVDGGLTVLQ